MKRIILLAVAVIGLTTGACRKQRTCTCKTTDTAVTSTPNGPVTVVSNTSDTYTEDKQYKKEFVRYHCISEQYTTISNNGRTQTTSVVDCDLK